MDTHTDTEEVGHYREAGIWENDSVSCIYHLSSHFTKVTDISKTCRWASQMFQNGSSQNVVPKTLSESLQGQNHLFSQSYQKVICLFHSFTHKCAVEFSSNCLVWYCWVQSLPVDQRLKRFIKLQKKNTYLTKCFFCLRKCNIFSF